MTVQEARQLSGVARRLLSEELSRDGDLGTLDNLFLLYKALRVVRVPEEHRELFARIVEELPASIQASLDGCMAA